MRSITLHTVPRRASVCTHMHTHTHDPRVHKIHHTRTRCRVGPHGVTVPRRAPRCHGVTVPWCHGAVVPRCHGATVPRCHGATVPRCHGATVPRCRGATVSRCRGATVPRLVDQLNPTGLSPFPPRDGPGCSHLTVRRELPRCTTNGSARPRSPTPAHRARGSPRGLPLHSTCRALRACSCLTRHIQWRWTLCPISQVGGGTGKARWGVGTHKLKLGLAGGGAR